MSTIKLSDYSRRAVEAISRYPVTTAITTTLVLSLSWTLHDYYDWKSFGTGGTPPTWSGYLRMTKLRINAILHPDDLTDPTPLSADGPKYLKTPLKPREGKSPKIVARTMPHRQKPEPIEPEAKERVQSLMRTLASQHPALVDAALSKTEGFAADAIYAKPDLPTLNPITNQYKVLDGEIAHAHPAENSLHVWLSEPDAKAVIEAGWGQRFPLKFVPRGWVMVYAPRTNAEVDIITEIVRAGIGWVTGLAV